MLCLCDVGGAVARVRQERDPDRKRTLGADGRDQIGHAGNSRRLEPTADPARRDHLAGIAAGNGAKTAIKPGDEGLAVEGVPVAGRKVRRGPRLALGVKNPLARLKANRPADQDHGAIWRGEHAPHARSFVNRSGDLIRNRGGDVRYQRQNRTADRLPDGDHALRRHHPGVGANLREGKRADRRRSPDAPRQAPVRGISRVKALIEDEVARGRDDTQHVVHAVPRVHGQTDHGRDGARYIAQPVEREARQSAPHRAHIAIVELQRIAGAPEIEPVVMADHAIEARRVCARHGREGGFLKLCAIEADRRAEAIRQDDVGTDLGHHRVAAEQARDLRRTTRRTRSRDLNPARVAPELIGHALDHPARLALPHNTGPGNERNPVGPPIVQLCGKEVRDLRRFCLHEQAAQRQRKGDFAR